MNKQKEISFHDLKVIFKSWVSYLLSKWLVFVSVVVVFGVLGVLYAWMQRPRYTAELTFTAENEASGNFSPYAGIAAQFGLDLGGSSGSAFEGENLMYLMRSRRLIEKTLFSSVEINKEKILLINYHIRATDAEQPGKKANIVFSEAETHSSRKQDSLLKEIGKNIIKALEIEKIDKKSDIISVKFVDKDEIFAKIFVEELVNNVITYYSDYKVKKIKQNVAILQRQTDSVRNLITGNIVDIAVSSDLNVNPTRQILRTGIQRKQVDAQVNGALYTELVKNLELSKLALRKETPLIQIIDSPAFPLEKKKMGRLLAGILFAFIGAFFTFSYYFLKKIFE